MPIEGSIASIGARAARLLDQHAGWTVEAIFERSFYIRRGEEFICIGDASIGDGPLNAKLTSGLTLPRVEIGMPVSVDISTAEVWRMPPWAFTSSHVAVTALQDVINHTLHEAPPDSFVHAIFSTEQLATTLARRARAGAHALRDGLKSGNPAKLNEAASLLLGLGHGLTPSGDDVLSGALVTLFAIGDEANARALDRSISAHMSKATSALSCAFLRAACDGEPSAPTHQAINALLSGNTPSDIIAPIRTIGHSSGFDLLAGALIAANRDTHKL